MSKIPTINEIDGNSPSRESKDVVVNAKSTTASVNEVDETLSGKAAIDEVDNTRKPTISEIYQIVTDGLFESTTNWWDYAYRLSQAQINQDIVSRLDNGVIGGGYSKGFDIITTTSDKSPSNSNVYSALKSDTLYPKKMNDETINGIYNFVNGLTIGKPTAYTGGTWSIDKNGKSYLTTDYLYVRLKAIFETLQILDVDTIGGKLIVSPAGSVKVAYVDDKKVTIDDVEQNVYRCYFLGEQDGEEIDNKWKVGDQAQAKSFNVKKGTYHKAGNHYLWRLVVGVSTETVTIDNKKYHYIDLSQLVFDAGSDAPAPGDVLNQLGYRGNDAQRQSAIVINAVDNFAPSISLYGGINDFTLLNKEYVEYGVYQGKAFFNVYGDMYIGDRGINPTTYVKYKNGKVSIKADLEIGSSIGGKDLNQYIKDNAGVDEATVISIINNSQVIKDLQKQTDGAIETWFYDGAPTLTNEPAKNWTDKNTKDIHVGDLYYDRLTGYAYRFTRYDDDANPYRWSRITDTDITKALDAAAKAQATADSKMKIFYGSTPPTNYHVGDMWVNATLAGKFNNDIARATTASETFNADHWVLASRYSEAIADILTWQNNYETKFSNLVDTVKQQKDESITVWFYKYAPTVSNIPANQWNTDALRNEHVGDIFYDIKNNHSYRWTGTAWVEIKDADFDKSMKAASDAAKAAEDAAVAAGAAKDDAKAANDLADSKRRIFYSSTTPSKPYDKGDLWLKQVNDKTETWVYDGTNWVKSNDKDLADFSNAVNKELEGIQGQLDGKAETWYQDTDPSTSWTDKSNHEGDIWYNTNTGTTNYWNGTSWEQMDIPKDVFDTIDGKSSIFVDSYNDAKAGKGVISKGYKERDLWILPAAAVINGTQYYKGDLLTATADGTAFNEKHWIKKVRYIGPTELADSIAQVNNKINNISASTLPGLDDKFNSFTKDGILDSSEKARLTDLLAQASNEVAAANDQIKSVTASTYLKNNANVGKLTEAQTGMSTAWTEYKTLIDKLIAGSAAINKSNIATANTLYNSLQLRLKEVKQYLAACQADILSSLGTDLSTYKYLKEALNQTTEVTGGLVLTSAIQLKDTDSSITAGINGIVAGDKTAIAAWYGGPMIDRNTFTSEQLANKVAGTDYARSLFRHDGSGYLASGAIYWGTDGVLHGDPNSFILQGTSFATMFSYTRLFYLHYGVTGSSNFNDIDYITPKKVFSRLEILPQGGTEASSNLPTGLYVGNTTNGGQIQIGNILLKNKGDNVLEITNVNTKDVANVGVSGGISAYGTYTPSTGGGGGLNGSIIAYDNAIKLTTEDLSKIASAYSVAALNNSIASLTSRVNNIGDELSGLSLSWNNITGKPSTFTPSAHTHKWTDITDRPTKVSAFTNDSGYLTKHQSFTDLVATLATGNADITDGTQFITSYASDKGFADTNAVNVPHKRKAVSIYNYIKSKLDSVYQAKGSYQPAGSYASSGHTHSVKINGATKTIAASGGTAVDLGTYLTSHQSLANCAQTVTTTGTGNAVTSVSKSGSTITVTKGTTFLTSHQSLSNYYTKSDVDSKLSNKVDKSVVFLGSSGNVNMFGKIPQIGIDGVIEIGKYIDFHYSNTANVDYSVRIQAQGDNSNTVFLPARTGALALTSEIPTSLKSPYSLSWSGYNSGSYDGSSNKSFVIPNNTNQLTNGAGYITSSASISGNAATATNADKLDGIHANGLLTALSNSNNGISLTVGGTTKSVSNISVNYASSAGNADTLDGAHLNGIFTAFGNNGHNIKATIGRVSKEFLVNWAADSDKLDGLHSTSFAPYNGVKFSHAPDSNVWHQVLQFTTNWVGQVTFMYSPEECQRDYWGIFNINIKSKNIWFRGFNLANLPEMKCVGDDSNNWSVWVKGTANNYDPYGTIQVLNFTNATIKSVGISKSQTADPSGTYVNSPTILSAGKVHNVTLWGQAFDGTNSVSGSLTNTGTITASKAATYDIGSNSLDYRYGYFQWVGAKTGMNLRLAANNSDNQIVLHTNGNVGVGTNAPSYKLHVAGDIYANNGWLRVSGTKGLYFQSYDGGFYMSDSTWIRAYNSKSIYSPGEIQASHIRSNSELYADTTKNAIRLGGSSNAAYISGLSNQVIFNNGAAVRFGETNWDWNRWAGLKYTHSSKTIYLGIADGTIFNADSAQSGGTINLRAGISSLLTSSITASGNILATGGITAYQTSDIRLKRNVTKLNCLNVIKSIGGTYEFDYIRTGKHSIGFIAQRVNNPLINDIVTRDSNDYLKINYWHPKLISLAFGAITEVDDEVTKLKARVRELENEVELLKNKRYAV